jgi:phosphoheptose isomerase
MFNKYKSSLNKALETINEDYIEILYQNIKQRLDGSSTIHILGNGGSAANASHIVGDFKKTFTFMNLKIKINAHSDNIAYLTAASNDLDYNEIYSNLVGTIIEKNDLIIYLSGSGNSLNLIKCANKAKNLNIKQISISGFNGGKIKDIVDTAIHINFPDMEISEDCQMIIFHYIKQRLVDENEDNDPYSDNQLTKYQKRVIEDLIA